MTPLLKEESVEEANDVQTIDVSAESTVA
jgi:hypothetical protein